MFYTPLTWEDSIRKESGVEIWHKGMAIFVTDLNRAFWAMSWTDTVNIQLHVIDFTD